MFTPVAIRTSADVGVCVRACVCMEEDLGLGKVLAVSGGAKFQTVFVSLFALLIIFSYIQPCG